METANKVFDFSELERIGQGSSRNVYKWGDKVIKVARNAKGLEQNAMAGDYLLIGNGILPAMHGEGLDYIIADYVPRNDKVMRKKLKPIQHINRINCYDTSSQKALESVGLTILLNYDVLWSDILAYRNWGVTEGGDSVLVDEGAINANIYWGSTAELWALEKWQKVRDIRKK